MAKIAFFELEEWEQKHIKKRLPGHRLIFFEKHLDEVPISKIKNSDILALFVFSEVTEKILKKLPKVKFISTMSTGYDHIDLKSCKKRKIAVSNVPSYGENTVAEHAMALLLAVSRKIVPAVERTKKCDFSLDGLRGFDLKGKTIGIIGPGRIGCHMIQYANAFGMNVIAYDRHSHKERAKKFGYKEVSFTELLKKSDVISIHVPECPETHHLINKRNVKKIKKGCVLINTARGSIVETEAILIGLKNGNFSACGLDVLEEECAIREERELLHEVFKKTCDTKTLLEEHMLQEDERVIITPHNAFNTEEALKRILDTTIDNIKCFLKKKPQNIVK